MQIQVNTKPTKLYVQYIDHNDFVAGEVGIKALTIEGSSLYNVVNGLLGQLTLDDNIYDIMVDADVYDESDAYEATAQDAIEAIVYHNGDSDMNDTIIYMEDTTSGITYIDTFYPEETIVVK